MLGLPADLSLNKLSSRVVVTHVNGRPQLCMEIHHIGVESCMQLENRVLSIQRHDTYHTARMPNHIVYYRTHIHSQEASFGRPSPPLRIS